MTQLWKKIRSLGSIFWYGYDKYMEAETPEVETPHVALTSNSNVAYNHRLSKAFTESHNRKAPFDTIAFPESEQGRIWLYNVSATEHEITHHALGVHKIPARKRRASYAVFGSIPKIVKNMKWDADTDTMHLVEESGRRVAMDFIDPDNFGLDQSASVHNQYRMSIGNNLSVRGVFWSEYNPVRILPL